MPPANPDPPGVLRNLDRLRALLREMFQLDRGDLDFGLYRVMNLKTAEVSAFLDRDLLPQVRTTLNLTSAEELAGLEKKLEEANSAVRGLGLDPATTASPVIAELNRRLAEMRKDADAEADVYNHLANFFSRYYTEGDFVSQRRYSGGGRAAYLIPYDGEEVKLHWANADQYYVKTTENYASYAFTAGAGRPARRVRFEVAAADNEKDNVKEADGRRRRFVLARRGIAADGLEIVVRFEHRPLTEGEKKRWPGNGGSQQARIDETTVDRILAAADLEWQAVLTAPAPTEADGDRTLLARHVARYTAKNSFDYFIHRDLGGFLRRELDLYLNTQVLNLDDLEQGDAPRLDRALARVRAIRHIGGKIIDFLAQLEDFQKRLWLKKKFVLETQWCVTLDRVPEALYPQVAANRAQCAEWVELLAADDMTGDLTNGNVAWSDPPSAEFLEANPCLVLDTRHFDRDFTDRLLASLSDAGPLDEQTDGLLVHGENFQALNLLRARYRGQVQCVYIDPPYNTKISEILYKNTYKHSSWLSMMDNRLRLSGTLAAFDGSHVVAIDENEQEVLGRLLSTLFPELAEDYRLRYALGAETAGSPSLLGGNFSNPFAYTLSVVRNGARGDSVPVDLPETFNYLAGLRVRSRRRIDGVLAVTGETAEGRRCLVLWRDLGETDHAALDAWFERHRGRFGEPPDVVYVNGDHTLNALRRPGESWTAETIEPVFRALMFDEEADAAAP